MPRPTEPAIVTTNPTRHVRADARERVDAHRLTDRGKALCKRRKETVERSFADAKQLFGHRYARFRSRTKVQTQCLLAATNRMRSNRPVNQTNPRRKNDGVCQQSGARAALPLGRAGGAEDLTGPGVFGPARSWTFCPAVVAGRSSAILI